MVGEGVDAAAGEDFESEVEAAFGPFVCLLGQDGPDQADDGVAGGEDAHGVGHIDFGVTDMRLAA